MSGRLRHGATDNRQRNTWVAGNPDASPGVARRSGVATICCRSGHPTAVVAAGTIDCRLDRAVTGACPGRSEVVHALGAHPPRRRHHVGPAAQATVEPHEVVGPSAPVAGSPPVAPSPIRAAVEEVHGVSTLARPTMSYPLPSGGRDRYQMPSTRPATNCRGAGSANRWIPAPAADGIPMLSHLHNDCWLKCPLRSPP